MQWAEFCGGKQRLSSEAKKNLSMAWSILNWHKTKNRNKFETTVHTQPTKHKSFLVVPVFCPAHILRIAAVN
jgi:hypothetical protein